MDITDFSCCGRDMRMMDDPHRDGVGFISLICSGDLVCIGKLGRMGYILTEWTKGEKSTQGLCS